MPTKLRYFVLWVFSSWAWAPFSAAAGGALGLLIGYLVDLPPTWGIPFTVLASIALAFLISLPARVLWAYSEINGPIAQARDARRTFLAGVRAIQTELVTCLHVISAAMVSGTWWNHQNETLPAEHWNKHNELLADRPDIYSACQRAYVACDRTNKRSHYHVGWADPVEDGERALLANAESRLEAALGALNEVLAG